MKRLASLILSVGLALSSYGATVVFPASTNGNNVFTGSNTFTQPLSLMGVSNILIYSTNVQSAVPYTATNIVIIGAPVGASNIVGTYYLKQPVTVGSYAVWTNATTNCIINDPLGNFQVNGDSDTHLWDVAPYPPVQQGGVVYYSDASLGGSWFSGDLGKLPVPTTSYYGNGTNLVPCLVVSGGLSWPKTPSIFYVDAAVGDDASGVKGHPEKPFKTVGAIVGTFSDNDVVELGYGTYSNVFNNLVLKQGMVLRGKGPNATVYMDSVQLADNCVVRDLKVMTLLSGTVYPINTPSTGSGQTNWLVENIIVSGVSDGFYFLGNDSGTVRNVDVSSGWDTFQLAAGASISLVNSRLHVNAQKFSGSWQISRCMGLGATASVIADQCQFVYDGNGVSNIASCVSLLQSSWAILNGCTMIPVRGTGPSNVWAVYNATGGVTNAVVRGGFFPKGITNGTMTVWTNGVPPS